MKAEELMVGDWVYMVGRDHEGDIINRVPCEILDIRSSLQYVELGGDFTIKYYLSSSAIGEVSLAIGSALEPIPITSEILEKNGFRHNIKGNWYWREYGKTNHISLIINKEYINLIIRWGFNSYIMNIRINYVHELQHAIKLCKVEKEIIL